MARSLLDHFQNRELVTVLTYQWKLAHTLNSSYVCLNVLNGDSEMKLAWLTLDSCVRQVLLNAL